MPRVDPPPSSGREHEEAPPPSTTATEIAYKIADLQVNRPAIPLIVAAILTAIAVTFALRLKTMMGFEALLPENRPSVIELNRVAQKTAGVSTLFVVLEGGPATTTDALRKAGDALVAEISKVESPYIGSVEDGVHDAYRFLKSHGGLYVDLPKLKEASDEIDTRWKYEVAKAGGLQLDDSEPPPPLDPKKIRERLGIKEEDRQRYPDGYYQSKDGKMLVVSVRSKTSNTDIEKGGQVIRSVTEVVERVNPASFDPAIKWGLAGDLHSGTAEMAAFNKDLTDVGLFGVGAITLVFFIYYLRFRTLIAMLLTIGIGVGWTFGVTQVLIGHLTMATGFLFTIIAGNGINFGIIYMARFLEARRRGASLLDGVRIAHRETWLPTLTAGLTAAASYASLMITEFRGFRDFGMIGSIGMVLCWIGTYATLPSILTVMERISPLKGRAAGGPPSSQQVGFIARVRKATRAGVSFGKPFAALVPLAPRAVFTVGVGLAVLGMVATVFYVKADPMEYNLRRLRNKETMRAEENRINLAAEDVTGYVGANGMAILVHSPDEVAPLYAKLDKIRDDAPADQKPFKSLHALQDFVPKDQAAKIPILLHIKDRAVRAHKRGIISDKDWEQFKEFLPPDDLKPFGIADMPADMARPFTEIDGTRGRIVYIEPTRPDMVDDAHYLFRWAASYRRTELPEFNDVIIGSGRAVIYADMWAAVLDDVPPAVLFSFGATLLVVIIAFRAGRAAFAVLGALLVGVGWMAGLLVATGVKLNFLNFIALPITFGIGVDYAVNIVERYVREGAGGAVSAVRNTGGAVILCSMTTTLGYLALVSSMNEAVKSLGWAAVLGEISCLLAAVIVLPAGLWWLDRNLPKGARSTLSLKPPRESRA